MTQPKSQCRHSRRVYSHTKTETVSDGKGLRPFLAWNSPYFFERLKSNPLPSAAPAPFPLPPSPCPLPPAPCPLSSAPCPLPPAPCPLPPAPGPRSLPPSEIQVVWHQYLFSLKWFNQSVGLLRSVWDFPCYDIVPVALQWVVQCFVCHFLGFLHGQNRLCQERVRHALCTCFCMFTTWFAHPPACIHSVHYTTIHASAHCKP